MMLVPYLLLVAIGLGACAQQRADSVAAARTTTMETRIEGTPHVVGSEPVSTGVVLRDDEGRSTRITGPLATEIGRLSGARVAVWGRPADRTLDAIRYEVVSVDGEPVTVGTVERAPDGGFQLRTERGEIIRLTGSTTGLREGQKIWVRGPTSLEVRVHGVIRP